VRGRTPKPRLARKAKKHPHAGFDYRFVKSFAVLAEAKDTAALDGSRKVTKTSDSLAGQGQYSPRSKRPAR